MTAATDTEAFAAGLAVEAARQHLAAHALAARAHVTTHTVTRIMDGTDTPCPRMQQLLAQALGVTPGRIYEQGGW